MPRTVWHTKKRILTEDELRIRKDSYVEHMQKLNEIDALKKIEVKKFANLMKPHQNLVKDLMDQITTGVDEGSAQCEVQVDTVTQTVRFIKVERKYNEETLQNDEVRTLFDEKTFDEVGEKQLSMWQDMEVDDSVDRLEDLLTEEEIDGIELISDRHMDYEVEIDETLDGLLTPMSRRAASIFLAATGSPDSVFIQTIKNVGLRNALEMIKKCADSLEEETRKEFMEGVFVDPAVGDALLDHIEEIPDRTDDGDINFHNDTIEDGDVLTEPAEVDGE